MVFILGPRRLSAQAKVKQSSTLLDAADHILLQEDGDLLSIHQETNEAADEGSENRTGMVSEEKDHNITSNEDMCVSKRIHKYEKEPELTSLVSRSSSIQTIISQVEGKIVTAFQADAKDKDNGIKNIATFFSEEHWI